MSASCALPASPAAARPGDTTRDSARLLSGELPPLPGGWRGADQVLVLWDGECGFCGRCVEWARRRDRNARLLLVPYQRVPDPPLDATLRADSARAMQVFRTDGTRLRGGRGAVFCLEQLGWRWTKPLRFAPLAWLTDLGYWFVARNRALFSRLLPAS
jgi:predicted DCC family thiol-disulfide oxidoreductase YuxK